MNKLQKELAKWEAYEPINNMGKWAKQARIDELTRKIAAKPLRLTDLLKRK